MDEYAPLWCKSNFSFLEGASHAEELVEEAHRLGMRSIALTDRDGVYGMVRAHVKAKELGVHLVCGAQMTVAPPSARLVASPVTVQRVGLHHDDHAEHVGHGPGWGVHTDDLEPAVPVTGRRGRTKRAKPRAPQLALDSLPSANEATYAAPAPSQLVLLAIDRVGWTNLVRLATAGRRRCDKGDSLVGWQEVCERASGLIALWGGEGSLLAGELEPPPQLVGGCTRCSRVIAAPTTCRARHACAPAPPSIASHSSPRARCSTTRARAGRCRTCSRASATA